MRGVWTGCVRVLAGSVACFMAVALALTVLCGQTWPQRALGLPCGEERLWRAVGEGDTEQLERALAEGAELNAPNRYGFGETPLVMASASGDEQIVRQMIWRGADLEQANLLGVTPLISAITARRADLVALLLEMGASADAMAPSGRTPLVTAVRVGNREIIELLLGAGADVHAANASGVTPVEAALECGDAELAERLRYHAADTPGRAARMSRS